MYEQFTDRARKVLQLANQEALRHKRNYVGTVHILLGLVKEGSGVTANVLRNIDLGRIRLEVEKTMQSDPDLAIPGSNFPQTPRAKRVIECSIDEARNLNHNYVGTEHLLLSLLRDREGLAAQVLMNLGLKLEDVRKEVLALVTGMASTDPTNTPQSACEPAVPSGRAEYARFTRRARRAMESATQAAKQLRREMISTEHILCGVLFEGGGLAAQVLKESGVDFAAVRAAVEKTAAPGPYMVPVGQAPFTDRARKVIAFAEEEADRLGQAGVSPEHLLLGLLRESEGMAAKVLSELGVNLEDVSQQIRQALLAETCSRRVPTRRGHRYRGVQWLAEMERRYLLPASAAQVFRILLGGLAGSVAGGLLSGHSGMVLGAFFGCLPGLASRFTTSVVAGSLFGAVIGAAYCGSDTGTLAGSALGTAIAALIVEWNPRTSP